MEGEIRMVKKSQRIWIIFAGLFIALVAAFAVPKTEKKEVYAAADLTINSFSDLETFRDNVNSGTSYSGMTVELNADIYAPNDYDWIPIGTSNSYAFRGTFNGKNHVISNLHINGSASGMASCDYFGLFGYIRYDAGINDLTVENIVCEATGRSSMVYAGGLVGYVVGAKINNCHVTKSGSGNCVINMISNASSGGTNAGGLIGYISANFPYAYANIISNCSSECQIQATNRGQNLGGLIGTMSSDANINIKITDCYSTGAVIGSSATGSCIGGFVGRPQGEIYRCYSTGNVTSGCSSDGYVRNGGFSGETNGCCDIKNCYSTGNVAQTGGKQPCLGGFIASIYKGDQTSYTLNVSNCYSTGNITLGGTISGDRCVGRFLGVSTSYYDKYINEGSNCYYLSTSSLPSGINSGRGTSKTAAQFASGEVTYLLNGSVSGSMPWYQRLGGNYSDDFPNLDNSSYKVYRHTTCGDVTVTAFYNNSSSERNHSFNNGFCEYCDAYQSCSGSGTSESPYQITNAGQLYWFAAVVNDYNKSKCQGSPSANSAACAKLMNDVTINTDPSSSSARLWNPIGRYAGSETYKFTGSFNGNNHKISGMKINMSNTAWTSSYTYAGFLGYASPGGDGVYNLTIDNSKVNVVTTSMNAIVGIMSGTVLGGKIENCKVMNSTVTVNATGKGSAGTFSGKNNGSSTYINCSVENCIVNSTSTVECYVGGFIGELYGGSYTGCHVSCSITATSNSASTTDYQSGTGGFAGNATNPTKIESCSSSGDVTLNSKYKGTVAGFIGFVRNNTGSEFKINKCCASTKVYHNSTATSGTIYTGGFAGDSWSQNGSISYYNCCANGYSSDNGYNSYCEVSTTSSNVTIISSSFVANFGSGDMVRCYCKGNLAITGSGTKYLGKFCGSESGNHVFSNFYSLTGNTIAYRSSSSGSYSYTSYVGSNYENGTATTEAEFAEGSVTCLLNGGTGGSYASGGTVWFQNLSPTTPTDPHPVLDDTHKKVYTELSCGGGTRYYTNDCSYTDSHTFENGFCTSCGKYQGCAGEGTSDSPYQISNAGQLYWFACLINRDTNSKCIMYPGYNTSSCGKLTTNITIPAKDPSSNTDLLWTPIGATNSVYYFKGTFDGNNKTISGMNVNITGATSSTYAGFCGFMSGATIKNVGLINSSVNVSGSNDIFVGSLTGVLGSNSTIINSYSTATVTAACTSSNIVYAGGLVGLQNMSTSNINSTYAIGDVTVSGSGTLYAGRLVGNYTAGTVTNSYCLSTSVVTGATPTIVSGVTEKTPAEFASGEVTCWLNGGNGTSKSSGGTPWYQSIDNGMSPDAYPLLDSSRGRVYVSTPCGQSSPEYSNYNRGSATTHSFNSSGFCTKCGAYQPCTGAGTSASPYQIGNAGQLYWFACVVNDDHLNCEDYYATNSRKTNAYGTLTANITIPSERLWKPIGKSDNSSDYYAGTFDGNNKTISNVKINITGATGQVYAGFFGYARNGTIKNLGINNVDINIDGGNRNYVGGLVGYSWSTVSGCHVTGNINIHNNGTTGYYYYYGGLFGAKGSSVSDCYVDANIVVDFTASSDSFAGSLVGHSDTGNIHRCYSKGTISAKCRYTGGLVGYAYGTTYINNCYSMVDVTSTYTAKSTYTGGLVGYLNLSNATDVMSNSYAIGDVSVSSSTKYVGRLVGYKSRGDVTNCYYLSTSALPSGTVCNEGTSKTSAQFASGEGTYLLNQGQGIAWYQSLDNNLSPHDSYPLLDSARGMVYKGCTPSASSTSDVYYSNSPDTTHTFDNGFCIYCGAYQACTGEGNSVSPYQIGNAGQLYWFAAVVNNNLDKCANLTSTPLARKINAYGKLTNDIIINEDISSASARLWTPIGINNSTSNYYTGTFDGDGHTISGMKVNITSGAANDIYAGLFGCANAGSVIKNVGLINSDVTVNGSQYVYAGGIAGYQYGSIYDSYAICDVTATGNYNIYAGGLVGQKSAGAIRRSYASGAVNVTNTRNSSFSIYAGGLIGWQASSGTITDSYATGAVSTTAIGPVRIGGLVGYQYDSISNSYATGDISVSTSGNKYAGKLVGFQYSGKTVTNSYYLSSSTITNEGTGTMTDCTGTIGDTEKTTAEFASGEVTCRLNNTSGTDPVSGGTTWYQTLGIDDYPLLDSTNEKVYCGYRCKSSTLEYTNYSENPLRPTANQNHDFEDNNGFCSYCDIYEAPSSGTGTSGSPYQITNAGQLYWFAAVVNNELDKCDDAPAERNTSACAKLMSNITINDNIYFEIARLWTPIGIDGSSSNYYTGTFDGDGYTISGMKVNITGATSNIYAGLFGYVYGSSGKIQNVGIINSSVNASGPNTVCASGLVAGYLDSSRITNCYATGDVTATGTGSGFVYAGGLVGWNIQTSVITGSYATGNVTAINRYNSTYAGGLAGYNNSATITSSYATGDVTVTCTSTGTGNNYTGGLAGYCYSTTITNSYATGDVSVTHDGTGNVMAGGLIGCQNANSSAYNGYSISNIIVSGSGTGAKYVGKVIGQHSGTATNLYYLSTSTITNNTTAGTYTDNTSTLSGATSKTATEFSNFAVKDLLQTYVDANTTASNPLSSWVQAVDKPEFSWDDHELSTTISWGNMTFAYDPEEGTWSLPEGDEGENIVTFVNGSNGAKLRYNAVFDIATGLSGITGGIAHSAGDVTYQGSTWPMVNSAQMVVSSDPNTDRRNTTLTLSGTPSGGNFDRTTPESPMEIGVIVMTISG